MSDTPDRDTPGPIDRRKFIRVSGLGAAALAAGCAEVVPEPGGSRMVALA